MGSKVISYRLSEILTDTITKSGSAFDRNLNSQKRNNCIIELKIDVYQKITLVTPEQKLLKEEIFLSPPKP